MTMDPISQQLQTHYTKTFREWGATAAGVDWGTNEDNLRLRYEKMLEVAFTPLQQSHSLLDVGCGFGGLLTHLNGEGISVQYTGIDVCHEMVDHARQQFGGQATFRSCDVFELSESESFDYVVCNGILTQKLEATTREMNRYAQKLIAKIFSISRIGIAFNVMTTHANFYAGNLYYRNPSELLSWCMSEISPRVKIDHSYPLYEYTVYLYRETT